MIIVAVHINRACVQPLSEFEGFVDALCDDSRAQPELEGVRPPYDVFLVAPLEDAHDGTEDFLFADFHGLVYVFEDGGTNEETLRAHSDSSADQFGSLLLASFDVSQNLLELFPVDNSS